MADSSSAPKAHRDSPTRLLLLGAGAAHAQLLARLSRQPSHGLDITLLVPPATPLHESLLPAVIDGRVAPEAAQLPFADLLQATQARCVVGHCLGIDTAQRQVHARVAGETQATTLSYQLLSIDAAPEAGRERLEQTMPGARQHALLRHPSEVFLRLWPDLLALAQARPVSLAVIGSSAEAVELVFALAERLRAEGVPGASFTLVSNGEAVAAELPEGLRRRVLARLRQQNIHVLPQRCTGFTAEGVCLDQGALLRCDAPVLAPPPAPASWLQRSGLLADDGLRLPLDRYGRHREHPNILAAGETGSCTGSEAARVGTVLARNLLALHQGRRLTAQRLAPQRHSVACGAGHAIVAWGPLALQGRWVAQRLLRAELAVLARLRPA